MGKTFEIDNLDDMCALMCDNIVPKQKLCDTCVYGRAGELEKPCIVYKQDCEHYKRGEDMVNEHEMQIINEAFDMSREEAIQVLRHIIQVADTSDCGIKEIDGIDEEALEMAIKALEQEPILDKITEIIKPLRQLSIDEMSSVEWQILQVIDKHIKEYTE